MNKPLIVIALLLMLAACSSAPEAAPAADTRADTGASSPGDSGAAAPAAAAPASESISDLASVFGMSGSFKCTYRVEGVEQVSQVKNGKMRSDATVEGRQSHTIFSEEQMWVWTDEGCFTMKMADIKAFADSMQGAGTQRPPQTREDIAANALDVHCEPATVSDSVFTAPSGCQDMGAMFAQMQNFKQ